MVGEAESRQGEVEDGEGVSGVMEGEREKVLNFGKHWGFFGESNKSAFQEVFNSVVEEKRGGMVFANEEGEVGGLVANSEEDDHVNLGSEGDFDVEEEEEDEGEFFGDANVVNGA